MGGGVFLNKLYIIHDCTVILFQNADYRYSPDRMTWDPNCYECKVKYRDPKAKDLVMYLHAWRYKVSVISIR